MNYKMTLDEAKAAVQRMNLTDNFLLEKAIADPDTGELLSGHILETVLRRKFGKIKVVPQMTFPGSTERLHGTRLDVYVEHATEATLETADEIFDIEADNNKEKRTHLPRRTRFYRAKIDSSRLKSGEDYIALPDVYVIMILTFDPFGYDRMMYTIRSKCIEEPDLPYEDGAYNIFLYCNGKKGIPSEGLRNLLHFMQDTREENAVDDALKDIYNRVDRLRNGEEVSTAYMKYYEEIWDAKEKGKDLKLIHQVTTKMSMGQDAETIARDLVEEEHRVREILDAANACGAGASSEAILQQMAVDR